MSSTEKDKMCRQAEAQNAEEDQTAGQEKDTAPETTAASRKKGEKKTGRRALKWVSLGLLFLFSLLCCVFACYIFIQTESGQRFLQEKINSALSERHTGVRLTSLGGSIPLSMRAGVEIADGKGVWLKLPSVDITLNAAHIFTRCGVSLVLKDPEILRLPEGRSTAEEKEEEPADMPEIRQAFGGLDSLTESLPGWLPELAVENIDVRNFIVGKAVYAPDDPGAADFLSVDMQAVLKAGPDMAAGKGKAWSNPRLEGAIRMVAVPKTVSDPGKKRKSAVVSGFALDRCALGLTLTGSLQRPELRVSVESGEISAGGATLKKPRFAALLPADTLHRLSNGEDFGLKTDLSFDAGDRPCTLSMTAGGALKDAGPEFFVRDLSLSAFGMSLTGGLRAVFGERPAEVPHRSSLSTAIPGYPEDLLRILPACTGKLSLNVSDWTALKTVVPGVSLYGPFSAELTLTHQEDQSVSLKASAPQFAATLKPGTHLEVKDFILDADLMHVIDSPSVKVRVDAGSARGYGHGLKALKLSLDGDLVKGIGIRVASAGDADIEIAGLFRPGNIDISRLMILLRNPHLGMRAEKKLHVTYSPEEIRVSGLDVRFIPDGRLTLEGKMAGSACKADGRIQGVHLESFRSFLPSLPKASLDADLTLRGTVDHPKGGLVVRCSGLSLPDVKFPPLDFSLKADFRQTGNGEEIQASLILPQATLDAFGGKNASIEMHVPLKIKEGQLPQPDMDGGLKGHVRFDGTVSPLWKFVDLADRSLSGRIGLECLIDGTLKNPEVTANVRFADGKYVDLPLGVEVDAISLDASIPRTPAASLANAKVRMNFSATDGRKGSLGLSGGVDPGSRNLNVTGSIRNFAPFRRRDIRAVISGSLAVQGTPVSPAVTGTVSVDKGMLALEALEAQPSFEELKLEDGPKERLIALLGKEPAPEESRSRNAAAGGLGSLNIRFHMPPRFVVTGYGLDSVWGADMNIGGSLTSPSISGRVKASRGTLELLNRKFRMAKGEVSFAGGIDPILDISMTTHAQDIDAFVNVGGTPSKIDFSLSSTPEMAQDDVLSYILFGKSSSELTQYELLQLGATMARMVTFRKTSSGILDFARKGTGLDVINVNQSPEGGAKLEMGKYIADKLYVGVEKETSGSADTSAVIQMELGPHSNASVKTGGKNTSAGVKWRMDY